MEISHPLHAAGLRPPFDSPVHRLDSRVKLITAVALIVAAVGTPLDRPAALLAYAVMVLAAAALARVPPGYVLRRWAIMLPFILGTALLPFLGGGPTVQVAGLSLSRQGLVTFCSVATRSSLAVVTISVLTGSTHPGEILAGLGRLGLPRTLVTIAALAWRYVFVVGEEAARMKRARDLRHYGGRWLWQAGVVGQMVGTLFIRSVERGERVQAAMLARGFDGTLPGRHPVKMVARDWAVLIGWIALVVAIRGFAG